MKITKPFSCYADTIQELVKWILIDVTFDE